MCTCGERDASGYMALDAAVEALRHADGRTTIIFGGEAIDPAWPVGDEQRCVGRVEMYINVLNGTPERMAELLRERIREGVKR